MTDNNTKIKLSDSLPLRTAGSLPSSRTEGLTTDALASNDIDAVKTALIHVWMHYQSLEFLVNSTEQVVTIAKAVYNDPDAEQDLDPFEFMARAFANEVIGAAYDNAHDASIFVSLFGATPGDALRMTYTDLDFSDPEREAREAAQAAATGVQPDFAAWAEEMLGKIDSADADDDKTGQPGTEPTA